MTDTPMFVHVSYQFVSLCLVYAQVHYLLDDTAFCEPVQFVVSPVRMILPTSHVLYGMSVWNLNSVMRSVVVVRLVLRCCAALLCGAWLWCVAFFTLLSRILSGPIGRFSLALALENTERAQVRALVAIAEVEPRKYVLFFFF